LLQRAIPISKLGFFLHLRWTEGIMKQDLFIVGSCIVAVGFAIWILRGNPPGDGAPKVGVAQQLSIDPELKRVSERSPYMRSER
jgi:hypothetical protein